MPRFPFTVIASIVAIGAFVAAVPRYKPPKTEVEQVADVAGLPRILVIGDSISIGWTPYVRAMLAGKANVHHTPQNAKSTAFALRHLDYWLGAGRWDTILVNFGLHDLAHLDALSTNPVQVDLDTYAANLTTLLRRLKATGATIVWIRTTHVPAYAVGRDENAEAVYNAVADSIVSELGLQSIDLSSVAAEQLPHDVHFTDVGHKALAAAITYKIRN